MVTVFCFYYIKKKKKKEGIVGSYTWYRSRPCYAFLVCYCVFHLGLHLMFCIYALSRLSSFWFSHMFFIIFI